MQTKEWDHTHIYLAASMERIHATGPPFLGPHLRGAAEFNYEQPHMGSSCIIRGVDSSRCYAFQSVHWNVPTAGMFYSLTCAFIICEAEGLAQQWRQDRAQKGFGCLDKSRQSLILKKITIISELLQGTLWFLGSTQLHSWAQTRRYDTLITEKS